MKGDLKEFGLVWEETEMIARDFEKWRSDVLTALCPSQDDEDEFVGVGVSAH